MTKVNATRTALQALGKRDIALVAGRKEFYWGNLESGFQRCEIKGDYKSGDYEWVPKGAKIPLEKIKNSDGMFFRPNQVGHLAKTWQGSDLFFSEDDKRSLEDQRERANWLESLGVPIVLRVSSGSQSLHIYTRTSDTVRDVKVWRRIERKLLIVADSDLSIETPERLMRLPGGMRYKDGQWVEQGVEAIKVPENLPTSNELEAILDATGLFPYGLNDQQFCDYKRWRKTQKGENPLLKFPEPVKTPSKRTFTGWLNGGDSLIDCVNQANDRLGSDAFTVNNLGSFQNGKARCECPFHQSKSGNSAFISQHNGAYLFYCRMCTPRAIDGLFFNYCLDNSVEPDNRNYPKGKAWVEYAKVYCDRAGIVVPETREIKKKSVSDWRFERLMERLNGFVKGIPYLYHLRKIEPLTTKGTVINHLPNPENYQGEIVEFNEGEGANLYQVAARMGYKYILDNSPTGSGKTYTVGQLQADSFHLLSEENPEFTRIIYCSQSTRNPNSAEIESKYYEFPSRNDGFVENLAKFTPGGKPTRSIYNPEKGISEHEVRLHGNCDQIAHFANAYKAGHSTKGFCGSCPHFEDCKKGEGNGYGYLSTAQDFLHERYVRANLGSIPVETIDDKTTLIIDESEVAEWVTPRQIDLADINFYKGYIKKNDPELYGKLLWFIDSFMDLFDESNNPAPAYGWTYPDLRDKLYVTPEIMGLVGKIQQHEINSRPSLEELEKGAKIHPIWLSEVISILGDLKQGSLSATNNNLTITIPNKRVLDSINNAGVRILQDATHSRTQLSQALGVKEEEILVVRQVAKVKSNVKITQLAGVGKLGNQRSQDEINRAIAIRKHYIAIYGVLVGFTDYKAHAEKTDLIHGGDARGSNLFKDKKVVVSLGVYRPNMGACLNEYIALTGNVVGFDDEGFQEYYGHKQASNIIQELGRLRANRRLDEELEFVIAADVDTSFLEDLGYNVEVIDAVTINPDFCNKEIRVKARNIEKGKEFVREFGEEKFKECTQKDFATFLGLTPQAVNNWIKKHLGGCWQKFKDMVLALMNPQPTPDHKLNEADLSEVQGMRAVFDWLMGVQVTDALFASEFKGVVECFEWRNVLEGIRRLPLNLSYRLLFRIIRIVAIDNSV